MRPMRYIYLIDDAYDIMLNLYIYLIDGNNEMNTCRFISIYLVDKGVSVYWIAGHVQTIF